MLKPKKGEVRKPTRTISGITPVAVMLPPRACEHGSCVYCPNLDVPQSYTPKSPVVMRAREVGYDSFKQVKARLEAFKAMNHPTDKVELIIMGGTFLEYPEKFQEEFIKGLYDGLNGRRSRSLLGAQKLNEKAKHRCVALCVETRPDKCIEFIDKMRKWGVTRVELGVQIIDDKIYERVKRGHKVKDVVDATKALKDAGVKIGYHVMPGLLGSNMKKDLQLFKKLFSDSKFKPDQLKLYPCQVICGSELEKIYWDKKYVPYTKEQTQKLLMQMLKIVPRYCRVMRVMREIPPSYLVAGTIRIDLRKDIEEELRKSEISTAPFNKKNQRKGCGINEIRYREIGFALRNGEVNTDLRLKTTKYKSSGGNEYFLEIVNEDDILFGLLRLRIFDDKFHHTNLSSLRSEINNKLSKNFQDNNISVKSLNKVKLGATNKLAIIRELHVYGQSLKLGEVGKLGQHTGLGKWLMEEAEKIVKKNKIKKLRVISGVGVREYYRRLGYKLQGTYMVKDIKA